jgi:hypothetical protein
MKIAKMLVIAMALAPICWADDSVSMTNKILNLSGASESIRHSFESVIQPSLDQMRAQGAPADLVDSIHAEAERFFSENYKWDEVKPQVVKLFTDAFTEAELREFLAFYETPTGQKVFSTLPVLKQQTIALALSDVRAKMPELQQRIGTMIQDYKKKADDAAQTPVAAPTLQPLK